MKGIFQKIAPSLIATLLSGTACAGGGQGGGGQSGSWPADLNGDGRVTLAEFRQACRNVVMSADRDNDGRISLAEWTAGSDALRERAQALGLRGWSDLATADRFQHLDADHDGYITPVEVDVGTQWRFERRDLNHDGVITRDEAARVDLYAIEP